MGSKTIVLESQTWQCLTFQPLNALDIQMSEVWARAVLGVGIFIFFFCFVSFIFLYNAVQYSLVRCTTLSCSAAQVCAMQCSEVPCQPAILSVVD